MTREGLKLLPGIHNFTVLFSVILSLPKLLESSIESDIGMRFAIRGLHLAFHSFAFFKHSV